MMKSADASGNPFVIDGQSTPPMRSAFAILNADATEIERASPDEILARATAEQKADPDGSTSYGQAVTIDDLIVAADHLRTPLGRAVNRLLDFPSVPFELGNLSELNEIAALYKKMLLVPSPAALVDTSAIAELLRSGDDGAVVVPYAPPQIAPPALPPADDIMKELI